MFYEIKKCFTSSSTELCSYIYFQKKIDQNVNNYILKIVIFPSRKNVSKHEILVIPINTQKCANHANIMCTTYFNIFTIKAE